MAHFPPFPSLLLGKWHIREADTRIVQVHISGRHAIEQTQQQMNSPLISQRRTLSVSGGTETR